MFAALLTSVLLIASIVTFAFVLVLTSRHSGAPHWPRSEDHDRLVYHWDQSGREERYA